jgi:hypothetical protein
MHNCTHYPELVMKEYEAEGVLASFNGSNLTEEELHHLQQIAALQREHRLSRSAFSDLCQSDLD